MLLEQMATDVVDGAVEIYGDLAAGVTPSWTAGWDLTEFTELVREQVDAIPDAQKQRAIYLRAAALATSVLAVKPVVTGNICIALATGWSFLLVHGADVVDDVDRSACTSALLAKIEADYGSDANSLPTVALDAYDPAALDELHYTLCEDLRCFYRDNYVCSVFQPHRGPTKVCANCSP